MHTEVCSAKPPIFVYFCDLFKLRASYENVDGLTRNYLSNGLIRTSVAFSVCDRQDPKDGLFSENFESNLMYCFRDL